MRLILPTSPAPVPQLRFIIVKPRDTLLVRVCDMAELARGRLSSVDGVSQRWQRSNTVGSAGA